MDLRAQPAVVVGGKKGRCNVARFRLQSSMVIGAVKLKPGTVIVESAAAGQAGDYVWAALSSTTVGPHMVPLDGAATTMKNASPFAGAVLPCSIDGANSVS